MEDADINESAKMVADGAFLNAGQNGFSLQRLYIHEKVYDAFVSKLAEETGKFKAGDPMLDGTTLGPLAK